MAPRQLAEQVLTHLDLNGIASKVEIAGPGFINIFLDPRFWRTCSAALRPIVSVLLRQKNRPLSLTTLRQTWRKRCVGHLRSTIIGDASVRTLEFLGHK